MTPTSLLDSLTQIQRAKTYRTSSFDTAGRNNDAWTIEAGETRVLADIEGPGAITHIWMTQTGTTSFRDVVIKCYWDGERNPSVLVPLGDFFCLGHNIATSFQSLPFTSSVRTGRENTVSSNAALNCYLQMPFRKTARIELTNEGSEPYRQYFYVDYETYPDELPEETAYLHTQFLRENPCDGWGHEIRVNTPEANIVNKGRDA